MSSTKQIKSVLIGADPEAFLKDINSGKIISAVGLVPGSKDAPYIIGANKFEAIQTDNVMIEFCQEPTNNPVKFFEDSQRILGYIQNMLPKNLQISIQASATLDASELQSDQAKLFGCDPDYNAWTLTVNDAPDSKGDLRTAGGHIHIGYDEPEFSTSVHIIRALDLFLTVPSLLLDPDDLRRKMYGKSGAFRIKDYGVELRTLSNFWIANQESVNWVFQQVNKAIEALNNFGGSIEGFLDEETQMKVQLAINTGNKELAKELCKSFEIQLINQTLTTV